VSQTAQRLGISPETVNDIYRRYGNTLQAKAVCRILGTTPEALKADADLIIGAKPATTSKFPRLK
jgi:hypothetical protein